MSGKEVSYFGFGAILSTLVFMTMTAMAGTLTGSFLPSSVILMLNILVGLVLIFIGIRTALRS